MYEVHHPFCNCSGLLCWYWQLIALVECPMVVFVNIRPLNINEETLFMLTKLRLAVSTLLSPATAG